MNTEEKKRKFISIGRIISYAISIFCLVLCIFIVVEVITANRQQRPPRIFGLSVSYVPTESMEPTIMAGDYVLYKKTNFDSVDVGDIVVYKSDKGIFIIHRIIEKNESERYVITQGDNNVLEDGEKVKANMIYGKYIMTVGILSVFSGGISKNLIYFVLILIFVLMIGMQVVSIIIKSKTEKIKKDSEMEKKLMLEQLKKEILEEELAKLRQQNSSEKKE